MTDGHGNTLEYICFIAEKMLYLWVKIKNIGYETTRDNIKKLSKFR